MVVLVVCVGVLSAFGGVAMFVLGRMGVNVSVLMGMCFAAMRMFVRVFMFVFVRMLVLVVMFVMLLLGLVLMPMLMRMFVFVQRLGGMRLLGGLGVLRYVEMLGFCGHGKAKLLRIYDNLPTGGLTRASACLE